MYNIQALLGLAILAGCTAQNYYYTCDFVYSFPDCNRFITDHYCGTNLVSYVNKCEFTKAHCTDPSLDLLHVGDCTSIDIATAKPIAGSEVVFDFLCTNLSKENCPTTVQQVCGTDGRTYLNTCEYEKAKCTHRDLGVAKFGDCSA